MVKSFGQQKKSISPHCKMLVRDFAYIKPLFPEKQNRRNTKCLTIESLKTASMSSRFTSCSCSNCGGLYPSLNHSTCKISGIVIRCDK